MTDSINNPLLCISNGAIRRVCGQAVDEAVLAATGRNAVGYCNTLFDVAEIARQRPRGALRLAGIVESPGALEERTMHMLTQPLPATAKLGTGRLVAILLVAAIILPMAGGKSHAANTTSTQPAQPSAARGLPPSTAPAGRAVPASRPAPKYVFAEPTHDFGTVWPGKTINHTFIVRNEGSTPLRITGVQPHCGCTLAGEYDKIIDPGKTGRIPLALDTVNLRGSVTKTATIDTDDRVKPHATLTLRGTVKTVILLDPPNGASWGRITPASPKSLTVKVTNSAAEPLRLAPAPDQPKSVFTPTIKEIDPGKTYEVSVTAAGPYAEGRNTAALRFTTGMREQPEMFIPCMLFSPLLVEVQPSMIVVATPAGQELRRHVLVRYNGDGDIKVLSAKASDAAIRTEVGETESGKAFQIRISAPAGFATSAKSPAELEIKTTIKNHETIKVPIRLSVLPSQPALGPPVGQRVPQSAPMKR